MSVLRKLARQTAIYGLSSIVARFLNFLLVPLYTSKGVFEPADYGVVTALYSWTALLNVVLTFGMETAFFRFSMNTPLQQPSDGGRSVYSTANYALLLPALLFMALGSLFSGAIADGLHFPAYASSVLLLVLIIGIDAITAIPMARLRQQGRPWKYAFINILSVAVNVGLSVFFFLYCMKRYNAGERTALMDAVYDPAFGVGYVFAINLVATGVKLLVLLPSWPSPTHFQKQLLRALAAFGLPLMIAGLAGMVNETADRIILKYLLPEDVANEQIGIYGACYKLAILMRSSSSLPHGRGALLFSHARKEQQGRRSRAS
ncbi:MAG: oligosaccharide flippase family protein [Flavobacteriales bacterium]|nr:oligosaccharide flippase family protein [Flavobacteriales bacterium]